MILFSIVEKQFPTRNDSRSLDGDVSNVEKVLAFKNDKIIFWNLYNFF